jgi:hypothetical protein
MDRNFTWTWNTSHFVRNQFRSSNHGPVCSRKASARAARFLPYLEPSNQRIALRLAAFSLGLLLCTSYLFGQSSTSRSVANTNDKSVNATQASSVGAEKVRWKSIEQRTQAIRAITGVVTAADQAWNHGDAKTWASHYSSHAEWVDASSMSRKIVTSRRQMDKMLPVSQSQFHPYTRSQIWIRFTASNSAEVHSNIQFTHGKPVAPFVNGPMVQLLTFNQGTWLIIGQYVGSIPHWRNSACGLIGNSCCSGWVNGGFQGPQHIEFCTGNAVCSANNTCIAAPPPPACGGLGQPCCADPNSNDTAYDYCSDKTAVCAPWQGSHGTCNSCGAAGQGICPSTGCSSGTVARNGECQACGGTGQPCCSNGCTGGGACSAALNYTCTACGGQGLTPCAGNICTGNLHPNFENGQVVCTADCGYTQGAPCTQGTYGCDKSGVLTLPQNPCEVPLVGTDLSNGGLYYCYGTYPQNSMIDTNGNCNCVPNTLNTCPVSTSVPKPPANNTGLCIQGSFTDIAGHGCS